jgi:hypothetical protein
MVETATNSKAATATIRRARMARRPRLTGSGRRARRERRRGADVRVLGLPPDAGSYAAIRVS